MAVMKKSIPTLEEEIHSGNFEKALKWLRENIHVHGRKFNSEEILTMVSGSGLKFSYFMDYARKKYGEIYGIWVRLIFFYFDAERIHPTMEIAALNAKRLCGLGDVPAMIF